MQNDRLQLGFDLDSQETRKGAVLHNYIKDRVNRAITERLAILWWNSLFWVAILFYLLAGGFRLIGFGSTERDTCALQRECVRMKSPNRIVIFMIGMAFGMADMALTQHYHRAHRNMLRPSDCITV